MNVETWQHWLRPETVVTFIVFFIAAIIVLKRSR